MEKCHNYDDFYYLNDIILEHNPEMDFVITLPSENDTCRILVPLHIRAVKIFWHPLPYNAVHKKRYLE